MSERLINLYSDTQTQPTAAMRRAIARAEVGDEQRGDDPSVNRLCERVAELLGMPAAVFLPSGTMCNEIAMLVHCRPGDEVIADATSHVREFEGGGPAALAGVMLYPVTGEHGIFSAEQLGAAVRDGSRYRPRSRMAVVEQTSNLGGGRVWPQATLRAVVRAGRRAKLAMHMDGARLMNAVVASGGALRQAGILAAAGLHALDHHVERLAKDHANARRFAELAARIPGVRPDPEDIHTNMVFLDIGGTGLGAADLLPRLEAAGVRLSALESRRLRAVTHLDVGRRDVERAADVLAEVVHEMAGGTRRG